MKKLFVLYNVGLLLFIISLLSLSTTLFAEEHPAYLRIPLMSGVPTLDPGIAEDVTSIELVEQLFLGLTDFDPKSYEVVPELATRWEQNKDGTEYTFKLRGDVYWSNGKKVNAFDIVWALRRNVAPDTQSPYANVLYPIKNAIEINKGDIKDLTKLGVRALDNQTILFKLKAPIAYFPALSGLWTYRPLPIDTIKKYGNDWILPKNIVTNGSYQLTSWERNNVLILKKNSAYYEADKVKINEVRFFIVPEATRGLEMYENNELDLMGTRYLSLPLSEIIRIKQDPILKTQYRSQPALATYYLAFNNQRYPTNNPLVRKAIAAVIDKELLIREITKGSQIPAYTFTPPPVFGSVDVKDKVGIYFNPDQAKAWLKEAGFPMGEGFPTLTYMHNESEEHLQIAQAVQAMLKFYLNINIELKVQKWRKYLKTTTKPDAPHIFRFGWFADYPDANNWLMDVFHPKKSLNRIRWNNQEFIEIIDKAQTSSNKQLRKDLYRRAEQILCEEESAIIPIYYYTAQFLIKPWLQNFQHIPFQGAQIRNWYFSH